MVRVAPFVLGLVVGVTALAPRVSLRQPRSLCVLRSESSDDVGYGPIGSLIRQGPVPFFVRLSDPDKYERSVQEYMIREGVSRKEAQGNMDAYFENPTSWALQKFREKEGAPKCDSRHSFARPLPQVRLRQCQHISQAAHSHRRLGPHRRQPGR